MFSFPFPGFFYAINRTTRCALHNILHLCIFVEVSEISPFKIQHYPIIYQNHPLYNLSIPIRKFVHTTIHISKREEFFLIRCGK